MRKNMVSIKMISAYPLHTTHIASCTPLCVCECKQVTVDTRLCNILCGWMGGEMEVGWMDGEMEVGWMDGEMEVGWMDG